MFLLDKAIRILPNADGALRAVKGNLPADAAAARRYLDMAFGDILAEVRAAMEELAGRYEPAELNRIGVRLYEKFRPDISPGDEGWSIKAVLNIDKILAAT